MGIKKIPTLDFDPEDVKKIAEIIERWLAITTISN